MPKSIRHVTPALALSAISFTLVSLNTGQKAPPRSAINAKKVVAKPLFLTGFEAPSSLSNAPKIAFFRPGVLTGQNGFSAYGNNSIGAAKVVRGKARSGEQAVLVDGARLTLYDGDFEGYYCPSFDYDPISQKTPTLIAFCDVFYQPALRNQDHAGLGIYDIADEEFAAMTLGTDGKLAFGSGEREKMPHVSLAPNQWQRLQMQLDFATRTTRFFLDGRTIGKAPFGEKAGQRFGDADLLVENGNRPTRHKAYFDNFGIIATDASAREKFDVGPFLNR